MSSRKNLSRSFDGASSKKPITHLILMPKVECDVRASFLLRRPTKDSLLSFVWSPGLTLSLQSLLTQLGL